VAKAAKLTARAVVTANDLRSGAVVYRRPDGAWSADLAEAAIAEDPAAAEALLALGRIDQDEARIVDPALVDLDAARRPATLKERIRAEGPTIPMPQISK
jgi:hypothetical protein